MTPEHGRVLGKTAIVTGAASGIGRAAAVLLAAEGAAVCSADIDAAGAQGTAEAIRKRGGAAFGLRLDVTSESAWDAAFRAVVATHGRADILVNSAGIAAAAPLADTSLADWRRVLAVNLDGAFLGTREAVRSMRAAGGSIVHVASASGVKAAAGAAAYSTSKAAPFAALAADAPGGRFAEPQEIAETILFLASDASRPVNGAALLADGGYVL